MVVADRAAGRSTPPKFTSSTPPPKFTTPPKFTSVSTPPPPPKFTTPPMFTPNFTPPRGTVNQAVQSPSPSSLPSAPPKFVTPPMFTPNFTPPRGTANQVVQSPSPMDLERVSGAASENLATRLRATGATTGEANRFANIANGITGSAPPSNPPRFTPKFTSSPAPGSSATVVVPEPETDAGGVEDEVVEDGGSSGVSSDPPLPAPPPPPPAPPRVKSAPIDTVLFNDDAVPAEIIADLLFEQIGGQELLTIARNDTVNGQSVLYQPIKNLNDIQQQYNPNNLLRLKDTIGTIFGNFSIDLASKIPQIGNGPNGANIYLDADRNIVIEFINILPDEQVEVQITSSGTIYEIG